jgi:hypothetical protein
MKFSYNSGRRIACYIDYKLTVLNTKSPGQQKGSTLTIDY